MINRHYFPREPLFSRVEKVRINLTAVGEKWNETFLFRVSLFTGTRGLSGIKSSSFLLFRREAAKMWNSC